jgi:hypothetical protein
MHLLFVRHAESSNNVLAEEITKELGGECASEWQTQSP